MSVDIVPKIKFEDDLEPNIITSMTKAPVHTGILNVWNESSLNSVVDQNNYLEQEVEQPQFSSNDNLLLVGEKERQQVAFLAAVEILNGVHRKSSDSVIHLKASDHTQKLRKKRCLSDTNGGSRIDITNISPMNDDKSGLLRFDSGIAEARPIELSSLEQTPLTLSDGESSPPATRSTVCQSTNKASIGRTGSLDERVMRQLLIEDDTSSHHSGASSGSRNKRAPAVKHLSQCSMGGSSTSYSSFYECTSNASLATDILSGLGFDDFENPELIPDRFIPNEVEHAKPTLMKENAILISCTPDVCSAPPIPPPPPPPPLTYSTTSTSCTTDLELPLGATADNFLTSKTNRSQSPPPSSPPSIALLPHQYVDHYIERKYSVYAVTHPCLETVPEETASDLSPSPRWLSPRVSLDHSGLDLSMPHLGASLAAANRKRSLPNRDGYKLSVDSMLSEQDSTVYFSITSYDDDIAKEREDVVPLPLPMEETAVPRRRRKGVHGAPQELLSWLQANPIHEEHTNEESWPFNEQLRLRRSLTEIEQRRSRTSSSEMINDHSLSPLPFHDPFASIFPRRFSINGPLLPHMYPPSELRRLSLPSNSSFRQYNPPAPVLEEELETDEISSTSNSIASIGTESSLRISPSEALAYKQEASFLRSEIEVVNSKLHNSEKIIKNMQEAFSKKYSDTQEWLHSELWMKERQCRELEEVERERSKSI